MLVLIAAAINAYRIDNTLVRAWDTLFGLGPLVYFALYVLRRRGILEVADAGLRRVVLHGVVVQCVLSIGALVVSFLLWRVR